MEACRPSNELCAKSFEHPRTHRTQRSRSVLIPGSRVVGFSHCLPTWPVSVPAGMTVAPMTDPLCHAQVPSHAFHAESDRTLPSIPRLVSSWKASLYSGHRRRWCTRGPAGRFRNPNLQTCLNQTCHNYYCCHRAYSQQPFHASVRELPLHLLRPLLFPSLFWAITNR
eukprot:04450_2